MQHNYWIYLFYYVCGDISCACPAAGRFKKKITNRFVQSFSDLYSICGTCSDDFPGSIFCSGLYPGSGSRVVAGVIAALAGGSLFTVAISASAVVYVLLLIL